MSYAPPANDPAKVYRKNLILNATPEKLVVMMYEGALQALERAKIEIQTPGRERSSVVGEQLGKAMAIIGELRASLDLEKGEDVAGRSWTSSTSSPSTASTWPTSSATALRSSPRSR